MPLDSLCYHAITLLPQLQEQFELDEADVYALQLSFVLPQESFNV